MNDNIAYTYIRNEGNHPVGALAVEKITDSKVRIAVSKCHDGDKFVTKMAKDRAVGRLNSDKQSSVIDMSSDNAISALESVLVSYHLNGNQIKSMINYVNKRIERKPV